MCVRGREKGGQKRRAPDSNYQGPNYYLRNRNNALINVTHGLLLRSLSTNNTPVNEANMSHYCMRTPTGYSKPTL